MKNEIIHTGRDEIVHYFITNKFEGKLKASEELTELKFFSLEDLKKVLNLSWHVIDFFYFLSKVDKKFYKIYKHLKKYDCRPVRGNLKIAYKAVLPSKKLQKSFNPQNTP